MKTETIMEQLTREAQYAQRSLSRDLLYQTYGKAQMALRFDAITIDELMALNHETIYFINTHARELN